MSSPTHHLRSGEVPRDPWPKPKPHTDLYNPVEYKPQKPLRGHENCTFDLYPHDGFLGHKFQHSDHRKKYYTAADGRDGPLSIFTESSAGYAAQRTAEDAQTHDNRVELDEYLTHTFCMPKTPPCKLARASPSPSRGEDIDMGNNGRVEDVDDNGRGEDADVDDNGHGEDANNNGREFDMPGETAFLTRDKSTVDRALKVGIRVSFRSQFSGALSKAREILGLNPGDRSLYVLPDGDVLENLDRAYTAYLKVESDGVFSCCADIDAVGGQEGISSALSREPSNRNREELRRKARESMARLRAELSPNELAQYKMTAREDNIRYRAENRALLAHRAVVGRARKSIAKIGYDAWAAKYRKRTKRAPPLAIQVENILDMSPEPGSRSPTPSLSAPSAQSTRSTHSTPVQTTVSHRHVVGYSTPPLGSSFGSCPGLFNVPPEPRRFANITTEAKEVRAFSLPPSSAPSSSSGGSEDGYDADLGSPLAKNPQRRDRISDHERVRRKVVSWRAKRAM
ncbi:hypothetical protein C8R47DRAFT_1070875 [Mycena vitilis]|nr:hypothetical protein C8R47DRAFT_1070875 [Mycena vitilis]